MKRISVLISILFLLALGTAACQKDKPTTGGGGDNSVTISGTVEATTSKGVPVTIDGATLTIQEGSPTGKIFFGPTAIGLSYSAKFGIDGKRVMTFMKFSRSGCNDAGKFIEVGPGSNIDVGGATLACG